MILFNEWKEVPGWVNLVEKVFGEETANLAENWHEEYLTQIKRNEKYYYKTLLPSYREYMKEIRVLNKDFIEKLKARKRIELEQLLEEKKKKLNKMVKHWGNIEEKEELLKEAEQIEKRLNSKITEEMIEIARSFPIERIVEVDNGWATCAFHSPDKNPSMYCKNNYAYCFSCKENADPIKLYMTIHNCSFVEAVNNLQ